MKKILVATDKPFAKVAVEGIEKVIKEAGFEMALLEKYTTVDELKQAVAESDAVIVRSDIISADVLKSSKKLQIVVRAGAGYDNVDVDTAKELNVTVMNTPGQNSNAVAELAMGMMIFSARNFFNGTSGSELLGKRVGLHGCGNIGRQIARIAKGFGMEVWGYDPYLDKSDCSKLADKWVDTVEELYSGCNYISINIPANSETKGFIGYDLLKVMPKNSTLVNTARKEVVNENDLLKIFEERTDLKYLSDIAPSCSQTLIENYPDRCFFTPKKMGAQTSEANINAGIAAAKQIVKFFLNGDVTYKVN